MIRSLFIWLLVVPAFGSAGLLLASQYTVPEGLRLFVKSECGPIRQLGEGEVNEISEKANLEIQKLQKPNQVQGDFFGIGQRVQDGFHAAQAGGIKSKAETEIGLNKVKTETSAQYCENRPRPIESIFILSFTVAGSILFGYLILNAIVPGRQRNVSNSALALRNRR